MHLHNCLPCSATSLPLHTAWPPLHFLPLLEFSMVLHSPHTFPASRASTPPGLLTLMSLLHKQSCRTELCRKSQLEMGDIPEPGNI